MSIQCEVPGRLRNIQVGRDRPLLPLFEAITNSFHAIRELPEADRAKGEIKVRILRAPSLVVEELGDFIGFEFLDNGVGFTPDNYESFCSSDSLRKDDIGGKGIGRFTWLKVFDQAVVTSVYLNGMGPHRRSFVFDKSFEPSVAHDERLQNDVRATSVALRGVRRDYKEVMPQSVDEIANAIVEHCLLMLMRPASPSLTVQDGAVSMDLNSKFDEYRQQNADIIQMEVGDYKLQATVFRMKQGKNLLTFAAHSRQVRSENLAVWMPTLPTKLGDSAYNIRCYVEGKLLDDWVDETRSRFTLPNASDPQQSVFKVPTVEDVREAAIGAIERVCEKDISEANDKKRLRILQFVEQKRQEYRPLLKHLDDLVRLVPYPASEGKMDQVLAQFDADTRIRRRQQNERVLRKVQREGENYTELVDELLKNVGEEERMALARHVANRRFLIQVFKQSLATASGTAKYPLEKVLHKLVFPMNTTSDQVDPEQNHLWLIDERFSYHTLLASDVPLKTIPGVTNESLIRPDIVIFDTAWTFAEGQQHKPNSIFLVEFKRPGRDDYDEKDNPIVQVMDQVRKLRSGAAKPNGRVLHLDESTPAYAFILCDVLPSLRQIAEGRGFMVTPDRLGYIGFIPALRLYVEIIDYAKIVEDAEKRNRKLFEKLGIET